MATTASYQDNDAVHSLPPFANEENKSLSEKVVSPRRAACNLLNTALDQIYGGSTQPAEHTNRRQCFTIGCDVNSYEECQARALPYTGLDLAPRSNVSNKLTEKKQGVYDAKCRQVDTEDHFKQLADRECGRLTVEIRRLEKETGEISDHVKLLSLPLGKFIKSNPLLNYMKVDDTPKQYLSRK
jgi:UDP-glucose:O-linked fucose beta-1,3-glucosyltransferase